MSGRPEPGSPRQRLHEIAKQADIIRRELEGGEGDLEGAAQAAEIYMRARQLQARLEPEAEAESMLQEGER